MLKYLSLFMLAIFILSCKEEKKADDLPKFAITGDAVIDGLTKEVDKDPLNAQLRFKRATLLHAKAMYDECIEDLRVAITTDSLQPQYYHLLSDAFMDNNLSSRSLKTMQKAAALFPTRIPTLLKLSETQLILKQYDAAILTLNEIIRLDRQNAEAYFMIGTTLNQMGEKTRAINAFQTATEMDAKLIDAWIALGNIYAEQKNKLALKVYETAVSIEPKNANAQHALAYYLQNNGQIPKAIEVYKMINHIDPKYTDAYFNCGILYMDMDSLDQALEQFNILVGIEPKDWAGYHYRALIYYKQKKWKQAYSDFLSSTNLNPENEEGQNYLEELKSKHIK